jgi:hypothetical protein
MRQAGMSEKSCLQHLQTFIHPANVFPNIADRDICVYVSFNRIMLSLQIFCGDSACRNAALK